MESKQKRTWGEVYNAHPNRVWIHDETRTWHDKNIQSHPNVRSKSNK